MSLDVPAAFRQLHSGVIERLYVTARAEKWKVSKDQFAEALRGSCCSSFREMAEHQVNGYLESLRVEDLALALACRNGNEEAWEHFVAHLGPELHRAARAITRDAGAVELADSLYADLFGLDVRNGERRSLFEYFHGRSALSTWLRAVLAQRYVDQVRASRRQTPLPDGDSDVGGGTVAPQSLDPDRARYLTLLRSALTDALSALDPDDRLRLSYYYAQQLTLSQIGRLMGEHEATVSRKLARIRRRLSAEVERSLRESKRLDQAQVRLCYEYALEDWPFDVTSLLANKK